MEQNDNEQLLGASILSQLQHKCRKMDEIYNLTKEIGEVLQSNDATSRDMLFSMRLDCMVEVDDINQELERTLEDLSPYSKERMNMLFHTGELETDIEWEILVKKQFERFRSLLYKTIALDKEISLKIAGKDSYYAE
jgi:hypothetical protein